MNRTELLKRSLQEALQFHRKLYTDEEISFMEKQLQQLKEDTAQLLNESE